MSSHAGAAALAVSTAEGLRVLQDGDHPLAAWLEAVDVVIVGLPDEAPSADASVIASALATRFPRARWLVTASLARDFPYNLARRIASLGELTRARAGVALRPSATVLPTARGASPGELARDGVQVLRALWQTWPVSSVVADRERRLFVESSEIRVADHDGLWQARGPLQVPVAEAPPVASWASDIGADLALPAFDASHRLGLLGADAGPLAVFDPAEIPAAIGALIDDGWRKHDDALALREVLGLGAAEPVLTASAPAFARREIIL
ncbi:MAG: hypothetical protein QM607_02450 [Microbacterium sp.]